MQIEQRRTTRGLPTHSRIVDLWSITRMVILTSSPISAGVDFVAILVRDSPPILRFVKVVHLLKDLKSLLSVVHAGSLALLILESRGRCQEILFILQEYFGGLVPFLKQRTRCFLGSGLSGVGLWEAKLPTIRGSDDVVDIVRPDSLLNHPRGTRELCSWVGVFLSHSHPNWESGLCVGGDEEKKDGDDYKKRGFHFP